VNSGFTSVNRSATSEPKSFTPDPKRFESPTSSAKNTPDNRASSLKATALKRQLSGEESSDSAKKDNDLDDSEAASSRRSKRLKKGKSMQLHSVPLATISIVA
jgi:histone demethylase JARID1